MEGTTSYNKLLTYPLSLFQNVKNFDTPAHVQTTGDSWHFPSSDGKRWLCARKAEIVKNPEELLYL